MAELRVLVLAENLSIVPNTHMGQLTIPQNSSSRGSEALFCPLWTPALTCTNPTHRHTCIHITKNKNKSFYFLNPILAQIRSYNKQPAAGVGLLLSYCAHKSVPQESIPSAFQHFPTNQMKLPVAVHKSHETHQLQSLCFFKIAPQPVDKKQQHDTEMHSKLLVLQQLLRHTLPALPFPTVCSAYAKDCIAFVRPRAQNPASWLEHATHCAMPVAA